MDSDHDNADALASAAASSADSGGVGGGHVGEHVGVMGSHAAGVRYLSGEVPAAAGAALAWDLVCFQSLACAQAPEDADMRLLCPPSADLCSKLYGMPRGPLDTDPWADIRAGTAGLMNLGNTCFMNASLQIFARVEPLVDMLRLHDHRRAVTGCFLCALKADLLGMRSGSALSFPVARPQSVLKARAGGLALVEAEEFVGRGSSGRGPQCDAWVFCLAILEEVSRWEQNRARLLAREGDETMTAVAGRCVFDEYIGGILYRTRVRCAKCEGASDRIQVRRNAELNLAPWHRTLRDVYEAHVNETRGQGTNWPLRERPCECL